MQKNKAKKPSETTDSNRGAITQGVHTVKVNSLKFFQDNPKQFTSKQFGRLLKSVKKEGFLEPLTVNINTRTVINGNQRLKVAMQLGIDSVPVLYMDIEEEDEGRFVAFFNKTLAEQDDDLMKKLLKKYEDDDVIKDFLSDYKDVVDKLITGASTEFEIVKEVDESYSYVVFVTKKSIDFLNIETFFNLASVYDPHKSKMIGLGRVIDGEALNRLINIATAQGYKNINETNQK